MTRIIGGSAGGRRLVVPSGRDTRPTSDRVREGLFSALIARHGDLSGARFLDLYAGSGAIGLEAASRGASEVVLVENAAPALAAIRANVTSLGLPGITIAARPVARFLAEPAIRSPFDVVVADPPYHLCVDADLAALSSHGWLRDEGIVVVERATKGASMTWPDGFRKADTKRYGDTTLVVACYGSRS